MARELDALAASASHLRQVAGSLNESDLTHSAYPSEWTVADVFSHIGSGAVIMGRRLGDLLEGRFTPDEFAPSVWDEWNAKSPTAQAADALVVDQELLDQIRRVPDQEKAIFSLSMGPMILGFDQFVGMRLNEHCVHTWDIEVAFDKKATILREATEVVVDSLERIVSFTGQPSGTGQVKIRTTNPARRFILTRGPDQVSLEAVGSLQFPDLVVPAEALVRLVYGRLDPFPGSSAQTPVDLADLTKLFPGF